MVERVFLVGTVGDHHGSDILHAHDCLSARGGQHDIDGSGLLGLHQRCGFELGHARMVGSNPVSSRDKRGKDIQTGIVGDSCGFDTRRLVKRRHGSVRNYSLCLILDNATQAAVAGLRPGGRCQGQDNETGRASFQ